MRLGETHDIQISHEKILFDIHRFEPWDDLNEQGIRSLVTICATAAFPCCAMVIVSIRL